MDKNEKHHGFIGISTASLSYLTNETRLLLTSAFFVVVIFVSELFPRLDGPYIHVSHFKSQANLWNG